VAGTKIGGEVAAHRGRQWCGRSRRVAGGVGGGYFFAEAVFFWTRQR
jgi:hypothetical protein